MEDALPPEATTTEKQEPGGSMSTASKRKKSKGRNGNIYIGVINRIEWMKLQNQFGFKSVNNFGTFVLETMRRVHGDVQFWCDLAKASGVYSGLNTYEWKDGFPHAINKEGKPCSPEMESELSEAKREELAELCRVMWERRLQQLKQQQILQQQEAGEVILLPPEETEECEEEEVEISPGFENLARGQYSNALMGPETSQAQDLSTDEVNAVWNEQVKVVRNVESFGKILNFIKRIQSPGDDEVFESPPNSQQNAEGDCPMEGPTNAGIQ